MTVEDMKDIYQLHYELLETNEKLKGLASILDVFYMNAIRNPDDISNDKDKYIELLSGPYVTIIDSIKTTIASIDNIYDRMDGELRQLRIGSSDKSNDE